MGIPDENMIKHEGENRSLAADYGRLRKVAESLPDAVYVMDLETRRTVYFNHDSFLGYTLEELLAPGSLRSQVHPADEPIVTAHWEQVGQGRQTAAMEYRIRNKAGQWEWIESRDIVVSVTEDGAPREVMVILTLITQRKQAEEELLRAKEAIEATNRELKWLMSQEQFLARTDGLTGVYNRRYFFEIAEHQLAVTRRYGQSLSLMLIDIDYFKQVNDLHGHQIGDEVLQRVARTAQTQLREADILARYGGDEFIVLLPNSEAEQAKVVAERIREEISSHQQENHALIIPATISAGIAAFTDGKDSLDSLISRADQALYNAKDSGRNRVEIFSPAGPAIARDRT